MSDEDEFPPEPVIVHVEGGALARELIPNGLVWRTPTGAPPHCHLCMHPCVGLKCAHCRCLDHVVINSSRQDAVQLARERANELRKKKNRDRMRLAAEKKRGL